MSQYDKQQTIQYLHRGGSYWNKNVERNRSNISFIDLSKTNFEDENIANLDSYYFPDHTKFEGCTFGSNFSFNQAEFGDKIDFSNCVFEGDTDFEGSILGSLVTFQNSIFKGSLNFKPKSVGHRCNFFSVVFEGPTSISTTFQNQGVFTETVFEDKLTIEYTTMGVGVQFNRATFRGRVWCSRFHVKNDFNFSECNFHDSTDFVNECSFGHKLSMNDNSFRKDSSFEDASFGDNCDFQHVRYFEPTSFKNAKFGKYANHSFSEFDDFVNFNHTVFDDCASFHQCTFGLSASFNRAKFKSNTNFSDSRFGPYADLVGLTHGDLFNLSNVSFDSIPSISLRNEDQKVAYNITGLSVKLGQSDTPVEDSVISSVQVLRSISEATNSINESRELFILQRRAEQRLRFQKLSSYYGTFVWRDVFELAFLKNLKESGTALLNSAVLFLYKIFSNYGKSFIIPLAWLVFMYFPFRWLNGLLIKGNSSFKPIRDALRDYTISNSVPFGKLLNPAFESSVKILFSSGSTWVDPLGQKSVLIQIPPLLQAVGILQNIICFTLLFLVGLGVRNYFKIN